MPRLGLVVNSKQLKSSYRLVHTLSRCDMVFSEADDEKIPLLERNNEKSNAPYKTGGTIKDERFALFEDTPDESDISSFLNLRIIYSWDKLNVYGKSGAQRNWNWISRAPEMIQKHILKNVRGVAYPGEILAIMGPSGAGKSTLLNALTLRTDSKGYRYLNGCLVRSRDSLARLYAYVEQNTLFLGTLTVREHLTFHAMIRMNRSLSYKQKERRVKDVISQLGLSKCQNIMIGCLGKSKGISGGEMKRLAFATEILTDPPLMFCDEPTSGLDSFSAMNIIKILKEMSARGKTVICTVHQPSSKMLSQFDKILILAEGRLSYLGHPADAFRFFEDLNVVIHPYHNLSDVFIGLLSVVPNHETESKQQINEICDFFDSSVFGQEINNKIDAIRRIQSTDDPYGVYWFKCTVSNAHLRNASWLTQFKALCWRSWLNTIKEPLLVRVRLFQTIVLSLAIGLIYKNQKLDEDGVMNINGVLFTFLTNMTFQNLFAVINVFCGELPIFLKEHESRLYRIDVYFLSRTLSEIPIFLAIPTIFTVITYFWIGLNPVLENFASAILIMILVTNAATSFGYFISCSCKNVLMALSIGPPVIIPFLLFGGYLLNVGSIPSYFEWLSHFSWFKYGNEALMINQWADIGKIDCRNSNSTCPRSGGVILEALHFQKNNLTWDLTSLAFLTLLFRFLAYFALFLQTIFHRKAF